MMTHLHGNIDLVLKTVLGFMLMSTAGLNMRCNEAGEVIDAVYEAMLDDAVSFCNSTDSSELRQHLESQ